MKRALLSTSALAALLLVANPVQAEGSGSTLDHNIGLAYVSGFDDIVDWYDSWPSIEGDGLGLGLFYYMTYNMDSGLRFDGGLGPIAVATGDIDYLDIPVRLTVGYTFLTDKKVRPYVRLGASYHIFDADYATDDADLGGFGAIGLEFGKRGRFSGFAELSHDTAEATFKYHYGAAETYKVQGTSFAVGMTF